jgi:tetratricopeptide (TPR) repeat protein
MDPNAARAGRGTGAFRQCLLAQRRPTLKRWHTGARLHVGADFPIERPYVPRPALLAVVAKRNAAVAARRNRTASHHGVGRKNMRYLLIILLMLVVWSAPALADASADCHQRRGDDLSILACTTLIGQDSRNAIAYHHRGVAHHAKKDYDAAITDFTKAIEINPQFATAYTDRGLSYANKMDLDQAIADYTNAIEIDPKLAVAYINRGLAYREGVTTTSPSRTIPRPSKSIPRTPSPSTTAAMPTLPTGTTIAP